MKFSIKRKLTGPNPGDTMKATGRLMNLGRGVNCNPNGKRPCHKEETGWHIIFFSPAPHHDYELIFARLFLLRSQNLIIPDKRLGSGYISCRQINNLSIFFPPHSSFLEKSGAKKFFLEEMTTRHSISSTGEKEVFLRGK